MKTQNLILLLVLLGAGFYAWQSGMLSGLLQPTPAAVVQQTPQQGAPIQTGPGYATTISVKGWHPLTGAPMTGNAELWDSSDVQYAAETSIAGTLTDLTTSAPNSFSGYIMIGNDNYESGTDRGAEVYYFKYPVSWTNAGKVAKTIDVYNESTPTWTGYDDGTAESTLNVSVGSGATVTSTELKIAAGQDASLGDPRIDHPLVVCFNVTDTGLTSDWDEIRPASYVSTIPVPGFLSGRNVVGDCYVLPTQALSDYAEYRFNIILDAKAGVDPVAGDTVTAILLDKCYYKDDSGVWQLGWGDKSATGTDTDCGMDSIANAKIIGLT